MNEQDIADEFTRDVYVSRDLRLADPKFLDLWPEFKKEFGLETGYSVEISSTYRSPQAQQDLYAMGRTRPGKIVTNCDGIKILSKHNIFPAKAIDVYIHKAGKAIWDLRVFDLLEPLAEKYNLEWGGSWKTFKDRPHLEIKE